MGAGGVWCGLVPARVAILRRAPAAVVDLDQLRRGCLGCRS